MVILSRADKNELVLKIQKPIPRDNCDCGKRFCRHYFLIRKKNQFQIPLTIDVTAK